MINILKLRKLEKENKQKHFAEESVEASEIQETTPDKEIIVGKEIEQNISTVLEQKEETNILVETITPEDNPVEVFRQNLLNEILKNDTLPEFNSVNIPKPSVEIIHEEIELTSAQISADQSKKNHEEVVHLVSFSLGKENYGVDIMSIREIIRMVDITKVPRAPEFIEGVINLRGSVIPVINLRTRIKLPRKEYDKSTRILVIEFKDKVIGFIVDEVKEVLRIPESVLVPPPLLTVGKNVEYITYVAKLENYLIILVDPEKLLSGTEIEQIKN